MNTPKTEHKVKRIFNY